MSMNTEEQSISQGIMIQIFSWLLVKSLIRFRCVSKFHNSLVFEQSFMDLHLSNYSKINHGNTNLIAYPYDVCYSIEQEKFSKIENFDKFYDHTKYDWACFDYVNGLFCVWNTLWITIFNPATREVRYFPYLKCFDGKFTCSIGFEPEENKYKVVLTSDVHKGLSRAWVFTLGIDKSWREMIKYDRHDFHIIPHRSGICISGTLYRFNYYPEFCIVAFDVKSEIFTSITIPIEFGNNLDKNKRIKDYMLIEVNGKLGILNFSEVYRTRNMDLWIFGEEEWEHQIFQFPLGWNLRDMLFHAQNICMYGGEEIAFAINIEYAFFCFFYNVKNKSWRHYEVQNFCNWGGNIYTYSERLFPLENIGSPTKIARQFDSSLTKIAKGIGDFVSWSARLIQ
ncbi:putative F-box protein At1g32420 [Solanum pennellii]|uniref:F-box protein At1g32420 n=1 Tax=Solanum pennellii TaxID=28526 RepID=A0ABM1V852_SOLPN|nr:putative F-box protein At1g32420 [Solanum pennellii]